MIADLFECLLGFLVVMCGLACCAHLFLSARARRESRLELEGEDAVRCDQPKVFGVEETGRAPGRPDCSACQDMRCVCHVGTCPNPKSGRLSKQPSRLAV